MGCHRVKPGEVKPDNDVADALRKSDATVMDLSVPRKVPNTHGAWNAERSQPTTRVALAPPRRNLFALTPCRKAIRCEDRFQQNPGMGRLQVGTSVIMASSKI